MDELMDSWMNQSMHDRIHGFMYTCMGGWVDACCDGWINRWISSWIDRWVIAWVKREWIKEWSTTRQRKISRWPDVPPRGVNLNNLENEQEVGPTSNILQSWECYKITVSKARKFLPHWNGCFYLFLASERQKVGFVQMGGWIRKSGSSWPEEFN